MNHAVTQSDRKCRTAMETVTLIYSIFKIEGKNIEKLKKSDILLERKGCWQMVTQN